MSRSGNIRPLHGSSQISSAERTALFDSAFDGAIFGLALVDPSGRIVKGNKSFGDMLGRSSDSLAGMLFGEITHPDDLDADLSLFNEVMDGVRDGYKLDKRYIRADGSIVETSLTVTAMRRPSGEVVRFLSQIEDVTDLRRTERELVERATQLELAMEAVRGGFWHMDVATRQFRTSDRLGQFIGGPDATGMHLDEYMANIPVDDHASTNLTPLLDGLIDKSVAEYRLQTVNGERWMRCDRRLLRDGPGNPFRIIGVVIDFTEEHIRRETLESDADTDPLTGLLNRRGLRKKFQALRSDIGVLILTVDLDGFKKINDRLGHAAGDLVLIETAQRLRAVVSPDATICRLGGDEFVILLPGDGTSAQSIGDKIVSALAAPVELAEGAVVAEGSVGGAWTTSPSTQLASLLRRADKCLYEAKGRGKKTAVICELVE